MKTECPKCKSKFKAPENYIGKQITCPNCKEKFLIRMIEEVEKNIDAGNANNSQNYRSTETEAVICKNCDVLIGKLEKKYKWGDDIVCKACSLKLRSTVKADSHKVNMKKPGKFTAIAGMRLGAGICDILAGLAFSMFGFPLVMIPFGIIEIISACNLLKPKPDYPKSIKTIAILEIVAIVTLAGWISIVVGIITLVFLSDDKVKDYVESLREEEPTD